jgi:hypothetical protein
MRGDCEHIACVKFHKGVGSRMPSLELSNASPGCTFLGIFLRVMVLACLVKISVPPGCCTNRDFLVTNAWERKKETFVLILRLGKGKCYAIGPDKS